MSKPEWASLMDEDEFRFVPDSGQFDTASIENHVAQLGFAFRDTLQPDTFVVCATPDGREAFKARRAAHPETGLPPVLLVSIRPGEVIVSPAKTEELVDVTAELLIWLTQQQPSHVTCEDVDVTAYVASL